MDQAAIMAAFFNYFAQNNRIMDNTKLNLPSPQRRARDIYKRLFTESHEKTLQKCRAEIAGIIKGVNATPETELGRHWLAVAKEIERVV